MDRHYTRATHTTHTAIL